MNHDWLENMDSTSIWTSSWTQQSEVQADTYGKVKAHSPELKPEKAKTGDNIKICSCKGLLGGKGRMTRQSTGDF